MTTDAAERERIEQSLGAWRQGDCVLGSHWFLFRVDPDTPLTSEALTAAEAGADAAEAEVRGFMVATQTCDLVRRSDARPFVEVCPLVQVRGELVDEVQRGRRPRYAYVPGVAEQGLVADLDRTMTVEKAVIAGWERVVGCRDDGELRRLTLALLRKRGRFAFPDDFVALAAGLMRRLSTKHDRASDEGRALRSLREIRVRAAPTWDAEQVALMLWFIRNDEQPKFEGRGWDHYLEQWLKRVPKQGRFSSIDGLVQTLDDLSARDYIESDALDLDHLSTRG